MSAFQKAVDFASQPIGQIIATLPRATSIFRRHKLDFCCGGDIRLKEAATRHGISVSAIEDELAALSPGSECAIETADTPSLIEHIKARYHDAHRRELPELIGLAHRVGIAHRAPGRGMPIG